MVAFGKKLKERSIQEWQGYYINYKLMKKTVKQYSRQLEGGNLERRHVLKDFSRMLDNQIEKIALFMLEQQGLLASRLQRLRGSHDALQEQPDISHMSNLKEEYRAVGQDLLKLLFFVEMNAIGIRKILKKFDKRFGYRFTNYYVKTRLLTPSVKVQLLIYFMLKYAMEILLSESSVITTYYFGWSTSSVAIFLFCLGLTVLPVNLVVGSYISNMFEDRQILLVSEIMVCVGILLSFHVVVPYTVPQYVCSGLIMFVSAEVLEGVNLSLLSRVMSSRLSRGTYNGGLLSTEAGTIARVIADATITVAGYFGRNMLLNVTLLPSLVICVLSIAATCFTYNSLY